MKKGKPMILVFAGAGASAAIDKKQYLTTEGFFNELPSPIKNDSLFQDVERVLREEARKNKKRIDIEDIIEILDTIQADCERFTGSTTPVGHIGRRIRESRRPEYKTAGVMRPLYDSADELRESASRLNSEIKSLVYKFYGKIPDAEKLSPWIYLLNGLKKHGSFIEIFTTNYDLVIEEAGVQADIKVQDGFDHDSNRRPIKLELSYWDHPHNLPSDYAGLLTKLHGSVGWNRENGDIISGPTEFRGDHDKHCILYPGYKGTPTELPFLTFHNHLRDVVRRELRAAIFIGFAFRDDYINEILSHLPGGVQKYVVTLIDKEEPEENNVLNRAEEMFEGNIIPIREGFIEKAAQAICRHIVAYGAKAPK